MAIRVLELFCGIGGFAEAAGPCAEIVAALDQSPAALAVYQLNHPETPALCRNLETATVPQLQAFPAEMWWLSPPCQPYSIRGRRRDIDDPRAASLRKLIELLPIIKPDCLGLENVAGFRQSRARQSLLETLSRLGYQTLERELCPTELGIPCRRLRYYLIASTRELIAPPPCQPHRCALKDFLERTPSDEFLLDARHMERFGKGLRQINPDDPEAYTTCFTGSYGKLLMHSGAFLRCGDRLRRFSPDEILRLLGFPASFRWPADMPQVKRYHLAGNSVSLFALREALRVIPALGAP